MALADVRSTVEPRVRACTADDATAWNRFVLTHPAGSYCHRFEWKQVIERAYGLACPFLVVTRDDDWAGVLPLVNMPRLPGRSPRAVSVAFCNYGDVLSSADDDDQQVRRACLRYLADRGVARVELRRLHEEPGDAAEVTLQLDLSGSEQDLWKRIGGKTRNQIRKAERAGLSLAWGREQVDALFEVYAANMGRLGTPVHSRRFFGEIVDQFGADADVLTVRQEGRPIGAMLVVRSLGTWADPFASTLHAFNGLNPNMLMYWEALRSAVRAGALRFDFGRSHAGSGTYHFKRQWGAVAYPLDYATYIYGERTAASALAGYRSQSAARISALWRRLPPRVQRSIGPRLRRHLP